MPACPPRLPSFWRFALVLTGLWTGTAHAGAPFLTDDAEPTDFRKWEIYNFASGSREGGITGVDFGLDLNYGPLKNVQLTAALPLQVQSGAPVDTGDVELAAKFKFIQQHAGSLLPDIAVFPRVYLPTGRGSTRAQILLPLWAQKDFGKWSLYGGGGYRLNPGPGNRNYWQAGFVVNRQVAPGWQLGFEYYGNGRPADDEQPIHGLNFGTQVHITGPVSLLGAVGQGLNRKQTVFYTALKLDL